MKDPLPLIHAYFDATLSEQQAVELSTWVKQDPENARTFARESFINRRIRDTILGEYLNGQLAGTEDCAVDANDSEENRVYLRSQVSDRLRRPAKHRAKYWVAAAVVVVLIPFVGRLLELQWGEGQPGIGNDGLAMLATAAEVQWEGSKDELDVGDRVSPGVLRLKEGVVRLDFSSGVVLTLQGPAVFEIVSEDRAILRSGRMTAQIPTQRVGFKVHTPTTDLDLGNRFGVEVNASGETDVVVFEGAVDLTYDATKGDGMAALGKRRIQQGEAIRIEREGGLARAVPLQSGGIAKEEWLPQDHRQPLAVIQSIRDNYRGAEIARFSRIVHRGFGEDVRAYVDQIHQWNGVDSSGVPVSLRGADYAMLSSNDKFVPDLEIKLTLARSATVFVLFDDGVDAPQWLTSAFKDTGWKIGMDEETGKPESSLKLGTGPGQSIDKVFSIWKQDVIDTKTVTLGPMPKDGNTKLMSMYGVVAVALDEI